MTRTQMRGVSVFMSLLVYGIIFLLTCTEGIICAFFYTAVYPVIASDYLNMVFVVSIIYVVSYRFLLYVYRGKKRRGT